MKERERERERERTPESGSVFRSDDPDFSFVLIDSCVSGQVEYKATGTIKAADGTFMEKAEKKRTAGLLSNGLLLPECCSS